MRRHQLCALGTVILSLALAGCATIEEWFRADRPEERADLQLYTMPAAATIAEGVPLRCDTEQLQIAARIMDWTSAWQSRNFQTYATFYVPEFKRGPRETHAQWAAATRKLIEGPSWVRLEAEDIQVTCEGQAAVTKFKINYRSANTPQRSVRMKVTWMDQQGQWMIRSEQREADAAPARQRSSKRPMAVGTRESE